jgi:hypothetical protein
VGKVAAVVPVGGATDGTGLTGAASLPPTPPAGWAIATVAVGGTAALLPGVARWVGRVSGVALAAITVGAAGVSVAVPLAVGRGDEVSATVAVAATWPSLVGSGVGNTTGVAVREGVGVTVGVLVAAAAHTSP